MLIFDFDGVLVNSIREVTVNAYNAVTKQEITGYNEIPVKLAALFRRNRFHFQAAGDAVLLMNWCQDNYRITPEKILTPSEYQSIIEDAAQPLPDRTRLFFNTRKALIRKDEKRWLALNRPFQPLWDALIEYGGSRIIILTNKNREAVQKSCHHFGLGVTPENIYSGDDGVTKIENFHRIFKRFDPAAYFFLDDSVKNLRDINAAFNTSETRITPILATWGYAGPQDRHLARSYGFRPFTQQDTINFLNQ